MGHFTELKRWDKNQKGRPILDERLCLNNGNMNNKYNIQLALTP